MASVDTTFNGGFWESSIAFFSHNEASPYLNFLLLAFLPTLILYGARDQHVSQFSFSLLSIAIFDDRVEFLLNQSRFALPPLLDIIVHTLFSNITPLLLGIFFLSNGYTDSLSLYLIGYFFTGVLFTLGTVFFVAGFHHEILRYYSKGINYQILLLSVGVTLYVLPVVQYTADEMHSSVEYDWSTVQSFFLLFMHSCYVVFKTGTHSRLYAWSTAAAVGAATVADGSTVKDVRTLLTPLEDVTVSLPVDDTHVNSQTVAKQQQRMDAVGVVFYLLASLTCLVVSCAAALDALERTASATLIPVSFLITIVLPLATSLITTASLTAASINTKAGHKAAPNYLALNIAIQYTLHTGITLLLALFPLLQLFSGGDLLYTRFSVVGTAGRVVTLLAANAALTSGHANWMIGATLLCIYLALATAFFAHSSTDL